MNLREESIRFVVYITILILFTSFLTFQRVQNSSFLLTDSGVRKSDIQNLTTNLSFFELLVKVFESTLTLNFGKTRTGENVNSHIYQRIEPTFTLAFFSIFIGSTLGILSFGFCIFYENIYINRIFSYFSELILSTPIFLFSVLLFIIFFLKLGWLPPGGYEPYNILYLILPGFSLGIRTFARIFLYGLEMGMEELNSNLFFNLKSRGINNYKLIFKYLFFKIFPTLLILILMDFSSLLSGAMVVEEIFFYPGIGKSTYTAIKNMDENLLIALLLYSGTIFYLLNRVARYFQSKLISQNSI